MIDKEIIAQIEEDIVIEAKLRDLKEALDALIRVKHLVDDDYYCNMENELRCVINELECRAR